MYDTLNFSNSFLLAFPCSITFSSADKDSVSKVAAVQSKTNDCNNPNLLCSLL